MQKEDGNINVEVDLFQSLKLFFDDVRKDYSAIDMEALSTSVEQPDGDDDDGNKRIRKRKMFSVETTDDKVHLELEGKVKFGMENFNIICENLVVQLEKRKEKLGVLLMNMTILRKVTE